MPVLMQDARSILYASHSKGVTMQVVAMVFPSLFRGSEEYLLKLFSEESVLINEKTLRMLAHLAKSTHHLSINFR
jgi:hypothetical protein